MHPPGAARVIISGKFYPLCLKRGRPRTCDAVLELSRVQPAQDHPRRTLHRLRRELRRLLPRQTHHHTTVCHRLKDNRDERRSRPGECGAGIKVLFVEREDAACRGEDGMQEGGGGGDLREGSRVGGNGREDCHALADLRGRVVVSPVVSPRAVE